MRIKYLMLIAVLLTSAALPRLAAASVIYTYTGNPYDRFETEGVPPPNPYDLSMSGQRYLRTRPCGGAKSTS